MTLISSLNLEAVYELANSQEDISKPVKEAIDVIEDALVTYGREHVSLSFNGGKDCTVLLHIYAAVLQRHQISSSVTTSTEGEPTTPDMESFISVAEKNYNLNLFRIPCEQGQAGARGMKAALELYHHQYPEVKAILIGIRRGDPYSASLTHRNPTDKDWPAFMRIHPIIDWTYAQVWQFLRALNVEYCKLYDEGYTSLGSTYNTFPNPALRVADEDSESKSIAKPGLTFRPAYELEDGSLERCGRGPATAPPAIIDNNIPSLSADTTNSILSRGWSHCES